MHAWMQLKGRREDSAWLVGTNNTIPIPLADLTAGRTYSALLEGSLTPHKAVEKFEDMQINVHWPSVWLSSGFGDLYVRSRIQTFISFMAASPHQIVC